MKHLSITCVLITSLFSSCNMGKFYANMRLNAGKVYFAPITDQLIEPTIILDESYIVASGSADDILSTSPEKNPVATRACDNIIFTAEQYGIDTPEIIPAKPDTIHAPINSNGLDNIIIERHREKKPKRESFFDKHPTLTSILIALLVFVVPPLLIFLIALIFLDPLLAFWLTLKISLLILGILVLLFVVFAILLAIAINKKPRYRYRY